MRGGKRKGAGRRKGSLTKRTQEIVAKASEAGISPLEVMLDNMRFAHAEASKIIAKCLKEAEPTADDIKEMLRLRAMAQACASDAAPYMHPRLAAVEHSGDADNPVQVVNTIMGSLDGASRGLPASFGDEDLEDAGTSALAS